MNEMMYGTGSPMWTTMPTLGPVPQQIGFGGRPMAALPSSLYGYGSSGIAPVAQQTTLAGPGLAAAYPFAPNPPVALMGTMGPDAGLVTPISLLATVAMRRGQPQGPTNDHEVEEFIYDALDLLSGAADVEVRCEGGRATLAGTVQHKRIKRDIGEIAWAIPALQDVQNNVSIASRRRARAAGREAEAVGGAPTRKQA
jgi:hypothetical protein